MARPRLPKPKARLTLRFKDPRVIEHLDDPVEHDLSAAALSEGSLFLSCDEAAGIERLTDQGDHWGGHRHFNLGTLVDLPAGPDEEMDIEGLECDGGWLWVVGSHALKRDKPEAGDSAQRAMRRMKEIDRDPNRYFLGRFPLARRDGGLAPVAGEGGRRPETIRLHKKRSKLIDWLADDAHLGPFLTTASKENGLDIEGLAARERRVWLGLRGPVLRGWGVVIELEMKLTGSGHLKARRIDGKRRYRKHLLPTRGLGIRDLALDGDDLIVLTGPTMASDGPAHVLRWKGAVRCRAGGVHAEDSVERVLELPYRGSKDHPEGVVPWGEDWLVVYDSPSDHRLEGEGAVVTADIWSLRPHG
jgi:Protein of unknown function (DUF3616)